MEKQASTVCVIYTHIYHNMYNMLVPCWYTLKSNATRIVLSIATGWGVRNVTATSVVLRPESMYTISVRAYTQLQGPGGEKTDSSSRYSTFVSYLDSAFEAFEVFIVSDTMQYNRNVLEIFQNMIMKDLGNVMLCT